jgi:hypothetical protein
MSLGRRVIRAGSMLCAVVIVASCDLPSDAPPHAPHAFRNGGTSSGGNGRWLPNGLAEADVGDVDPAHGLDSELGLPSDGELFSDPAGLALATYLVECALDEDDSITKLVDGEEHELWGALGLAPEWRDGPCDEDCQEWVSACLLARTNVSGASVMLWIAADHPSVGLGHPTAGPFVYEATFYGNLFADAQARHLCRGPQAAGGALGAALAGRTCGDQPLDACGFTDWGACGAASRCSFDNSFATECAAGADPLVGPRHHSISTFVSIAGWQGS